MALSVRNSAARSQQCFANNTVDSAVNCQKNIYCIFNPNPLPALAGTEQHAPTAGLCPQKSAAHALGCTLVTALGLSFSHECDVDQIMLPQAGTVQHAPLAAPSSQHCGLSFSYKCDVGQLILPQAGTGQHAPSAALCPQHLESPGSSDCPPGGPCWPWGRQGRGPQLCTVQASMSECLHLRLKEADLWRPFGMQAGGGPPLKAQGS
eukprot:1160409-Pelagomonas_calceolata.AAC.8